MHEVLSPGLLSGDEDGTLGKVGMGVLKPAKQEAYYRKSLPSPGLPLW